MAKYDLDHLTQSESQDVVGPIQDDEALALFAVIRCMRLRNVLELGGLDGYSARNFLAAVGPEGTVITVDVNKVISLSKNHITIVRDAGDLSISDLPVKKIDLIFFDCHQFVAQMRLFYRLRSEGAIDETTIVALHDTNTHPFQIAPWAYPVEGGYVHQQPERVMANALHRLGYDALSLHTKAEQHSPDFPYRHGLTLLQRSKALVPTSVIEETNEHSRPGRLAVIVRAHAADEKTLNLIASLSGSSAYDLYVCVNETAGWIQYDKLATKISVTSDDFERLGFPCRNQYTMLYLSDVLFTICKRRIPFYKHYAIVEYDVQFEGAATGLMDELAGRLADEKQPEIDLIGTNVMDQSAEWMWHRSSSQRYNHVISTFFPFVILSDRAITQLSAARQEERLSRVRRNVLGEPSAEGKIDDWVFCEAFVASELKRAGFAIVDLNWLVERAYQGRSFNVGPAHFFEEGTVYDETVRIVHPVCPMRDTLQKRLYLASTNGTMSEYLELLDSRVWPLPDQFIDDLRRRAVSHTR